MQVAQDFPVLSLLQLLQILVVILGSTAVLSLFSSHRKNWLAARCEPVFAMTGKEALKTTTIVYSFRF